jgi:hypothetical protein
MTPAAIMRTLGGLILADGILVGALLGVARASPDPAVGFWSSMLVAALLVSMAGMLPSWLAGQGRGRSPTAVRTPPARATAGAPAAGTAADDLSALRAEGTDGRAGWPQALVVAIPLAVVLLELVWHRPADPGAGSAGGALLPAIIAIVLVFPLIVVELLLADIPLALMPGRDAAMRLLRIPFAIALLGGGSLLACHMGWPAAWYAQWPAYLLVGGVAIEVLARAGLHLLLGARTPNACADSLLAGAVLARRDPLRACSDGLRERFGVDLRQSWSARIIGRALPWVAAGVIALGWALTALTLVPLGSRVVLQGAAGARVLAAGMHVHAPWPFMTSLVIEDGRIHETILGALEAPLPAIDAQAEPPAAYDRLWEIAHPAESEFIVPAPTSIGGGPGFQVVSGDVRVRWRVGGSDGEAISAVSLLDDADAAVARTARRALTASCASRPLSDLMGLDRDRLGGELRLQLQDDLDRAVGGSSGIVVVAVLFDAIHPPVGAASAYQQVQTSEISALATVARAHADAARAAADAAIDAADRRTRASATAVETRSAAAAAAVRFAADRAAWHAHPEALATESWLAALARGMSGKPVLLLDHHLDLHDLPQAPLQLLPPGSQK